MLFVASAYLERDMGINRGNKKLLEKLVEISKGKHVMCAVAVKPLFSYPLSLSTPHSRVSPIPHHS
jgi:hypothetical protein